MIESTPFFLLPYKLGRSAFSWLSYKTRVAEDMGNWRGGGTYSYIHVLHYLFLWNKLFSSFVNMNTWIQNDFIYDGVLPPSLPSHLTSTAPSVQKCLSFSSWKHCESFFSPPVHLILNFRKGYAVLVYSEFVPLKFTVFTYPSSRQTTFASVNVQWSLHTFFQELSRYTSTSPSLLREEPTNRKSD